MELPIFQRHNRAILSNFEVDHLAESTWRIKSGWNIYEVTKESDIICCDEICNICQICLHNYSCTCPDSSNGNLCKHVHYVVIRREIGYNVSSPSMEYTPTEALGMSLDRVERGICQRHNRAMSSYFEINLLAENIWMVKSGPIIYVVTKQSDIICCDVICSICKICLHNYSCTCPDSMKGNLCKHVHSVVLQREISYNVSSPSMEHAQTEASETSVDLEAHAIKDSLNETLSRLCEEVNSLEVENIETDKERFSEILRNLHNGLNLLLSGTFHRKSYKDRLRARCKKKTEPQTSLNPERKKIKKVSSSQKAPEMLQVSCGIKEEPQEMEEVLCGVIKEEPQEVDEVVCSVIKEESQDMDKVVCSVIKEEPQELEEAVCSVLKEEPQEVEEAVYPVVKEQPQEMEQILCGVIKQEPQEKEEIACGVIKEDSQSSVLSDVKNRKTRRRRKRV